ncbi:MAG: hypothetical protein LBJ84_01615, partial [Oscillospiraceae bacterium]|nr:hypothetical protein [Oscillospiraceae bacterium]
AVRGLMGAETFNAALNELPAAYRDMSAETREAEVVANYLQEQFGNEQSMSRIMSEKPGVVRRVLDAIRNWIANISSRLTTTAADRATATQLRQLERRIGKMMRGAGENAQSGGELVINRYISRLDAQAALSKLTGKDLVNDETGIVAQVNRAQQKKLISDAAVSKSVSNGFNAGKHYTAAANIAELWTSATLIESRTDNNSEKNVLSIKRFSAPLRFGTERADAYITAKESLDAGHRIYSLELTDIKKVPASHDHAPQQGSNTADTGLYDGIVTQPADSVNTQTALTRENIERNLDKLPKYSIAYHGTPHTFSEFLLDHIGEGEGAQGGGAKYSLADGDAEVEAGSLKLGDADNNRGRWTKKEKTYWDIGAKLRGEYENRSYRFAVQEAVYGDSETVSRVDWEDAPAVRWLEAGFHGKEPEFAYGRRYGKIPESGRSFNYADNSPEDGVSILPNTSRDKVYDMWYGDEPMVYVSGWYFGDRGSDGEPLLLDAKAITKEEYDSPTRGVDVRYSLSEAGAAENKRTVAAMQPVATLTGDEFRNESGTVLQKIGKFFKGVGSVENPDIGAISLTESGVRDSLSHGFGNEKIAAFAAVPDVLREGKVIQSSDNYEGRNYDTFVIAAPVTINKTPYFEGVVVMRQESNSIQRYYMHEVWTENEETGARSQTDVTQKGKLASGSPASTVNSVLQDLWNVKREISGGANNAPMYSAADSDYTQFLDAYPDVRAEALTEGARELFENAWSGIANNEELSISEALRLSDYVIELAETYDDAQESGDNASAQSAREKLVSFDDGTESDYGERKIIKMTKAAAEAHRVTLNELDETPTAVEVAAETPPPDAVAAPPAEPIPPRGNVGAGFKPARSESSEQSQKKTTQQTAQAERAATRAAAVAKFTGVGEAAIKETERLREGFKDVKPEARVAAKQENTRRMADNIADEFGVRSAKSREKLFGFLDDMSALVRAGKSPDFVKLESLARGAAELALRRQFPAASSANLSPVEVAEANAALEIAARELTNDILSAFADGRNTKGRRSAAARIPALSAPYMNLVEMFGAYPQGEKAARIFPVPLNTDPNDKNKRVSKLLRNAAEASVTPPETLKLLEKATLEQAFTYTKESLAPHMEDALTRVTPDTLDAQIGRLGAIFDERGIRQLPLSLQEVADFTELYDQLNNAKRYQDATDVWIKLSMFATWGGQSVAGWRMLKMKGPGGELSKMESEVKRFNKADGGNYELPDSIRDKVLGNAEQGIPPLDMEDDDAVAAVEAEFVSWLAARKPATRREKFRKWRYTAMLTNPVTWIRNFIGNASMSAINISAKPLERAMQRAFLPQDQRTATTQRSTKETREYAQKSYGEIADILRGDNPADLTARVRAERVKFKRRFANAMDELTDAAMNGVPASEKSAVKKALSLLSDSKFLKMYYTNALSDYITAQGIDVSETNESLETMKSLNAARQYAMDEALRLTYRQNNKFSKLYNKLLTSAFLTGAGESGPGFSDELRMMIIGGAMPYAKVPSNILSTALNITPAGFIYDTARVMYQAGAEHNGKSMPPNARAIAISKLAQSVSGSLLLTTLGVFGSLMGTIRIKQPDDDKGDSDYQSGRRSYSLEMFGISIPLAWAAPLSVPLFVGATAAEAVQGKLSKLGGDDSFFGVVGTIAAGLVDPVFEMSMVKGVNDLLQGIRYSENGGALILGLGASIIESYYVQAWPSALARLAAVFDSAQRRTTANPENEIPDGLERSFLSMAYRIPGIRNLVLEPKVDVWGREMRSEDVAMRILNNLLLPAYISKIVEPVFDQELGRLYDTFSYKERLPQGVDAEQAAQLRNMVYPSATPQTFTFEGESGHRLSDEEYTKLARAAGKLKYDLAAEYINSETYALLSDAERAEGLDLIYRYANSMARYEMYGDKVSTTKTDIAARDIAKG